MVMNYAFIKNVLNLSYAEGILFVQGLTFPPFLQCPTPLERLGKAQRGQGGIQLGLWQPCITSVGVEGISAILVDKFAAYTIEPTTSKKNKISFFMI